MDHVIQNLRQLRMKIHPECAVLDIKPFITEKRIALSSGVVLILRMVVHQERHLRSLEHSIQLFTRGGQRADNLRIGSNARCEDIPCFRCLLKPQNFKIPKSDIVKVRLKHFDRLSR